MRGHFSNPSDTQCQDDLYVNYRDYPDWRYWSHAVEYNFVSGCGYRHVRD